VAQTLPYPSVHIVIEKGHCEVRGVQTSKFSRRLQGRGRVFGIKFHPGAFYPLLGAPVSQLTERSRSLRSVFGPEGLALQKTILAEEDEAKCVQHAKAFLTARLPAPDPTMARVKSVVEMIAQNKSITRVEQVASSLELKLRALQRLFQRYVGVSPKWVIQRYRLYEALELLSTGSTLDLATLAQQLGYFDQAHFIHDFKTIVGQSPGRYLRGVGR
jgi:AraC-like DNA-binding protein